MRRRFVKASITHVVTSCESFTCAPAGFLEPVVGCFEEDLLPAGIRLRRRFDKLERCRFGVFSCDCLFGCYCWFLAKERDGICW
ncbi:hypothetical protein F511_42955 [Dorcoceras hygrometricum]|uniref:Uncharacterized protein n=1 Tax=Dorcoceras hygrometricum TaxID=472368 RepID=A0A2Z7C0M5_9LAMI|nr:hypothetical protein F511_42955 [Dorcoceras hygrometricum]